MNEPRSRRHNSSASTAPNARRVIHPSGMISAGYEHYEHDPSCDDLPPVTLTVWGHDPYAHENQVLVDMKLFPQAREGAVAELWTTIEGQRRNFYFQLKDKGERSNAQISINTNLLGLLHIRPRSTVQVRLRPSAVAHIDTVEMHFKGMDLTRADQFRIGQRLSNTCVYQNQRVHYLGGLVRLTVNKIYRNGRRKFSGFIGPHTRLVFRSDSSRMLIFIQMSAEMWQFDSKGDIVFDQLVNSFIPEMLHRWYRHGDHHLVTIVLFTSVSANGTTTKRLEPGELDPDATDYYRVVIDKVHISRWADIMTKLRYEFANFEKEVLCNNRGELRGRILPSAKCNMLRAWSLANTLLNTSVSDQDLCRANHQAMFITPGPGVFDVDRAAFYQVSTNMLKSQIGTELVCLSRPPLHVTPMIRAFDGSGRLKYYVPTWMNVSFWNFQSKFQNQWIPRCKIYDVQMMGVTENEIKSVSIRHMAPGPYTTRFMKNFDTNVFKSVDMIANQRQIEEAAQSSASATMLRPLDLSSAQSRAVSESTLAVATMSPITGDSEPNKARSTLGALLKGSKSTSVSIAASQLLRPMRSFSVVSGQALSPTSRSVSSPLTRQDSSAQAGRLRAAQTPGASHHSDPARPAYARQVSTLRSAAVPIPGHPAKLSLARPSILGRMSPGQKLIGTPTLGQSPGRSPTEHGQSSTAAGSPAEKFPLQHSQENNDPHWHMWRVLRNPSIVDHPTRVRAYGRWVNVYPPGTSRKTVSWHSLKSPASLPITTEVFPTPHEFQNHYKFQFYDVAVGLYHDKITAGNMLNELVALRLQMGFQIAVGDAVVKVERSLADGDPDMLCQVAPPRDYIGSRVYLLRNTLIHRLSIEQDGVVNVQVYTWVDPDQELATAQQSIIYPLRVKTKFDKNYYAVDQRFSETVDDGVTINWSILDQHATDLDDPTRSIDKSYHTSTRFVLLPPEIGSNTELPAPYDKFSREELDVEAVTKVVQTLLKSRYYASDNKPAAAESDSVFFYTSSLQRCIESMYEESDHSKSQSLFLKDRLNKGMSLHSLAAEMQGERGVLFIDRSWHWKTYRNAFSGQNMVHWLLIAFSDISTIEEALDYGNHLMEVNFMHHVDRRHPFMNGYYFYQLAPEFVLDRSKDTGSRKIKRWFGGVPPASGGDGSRSPDAQKRRVVISRAIPIDVDMKKLSDRPELINVHIDRVHNPQYTYGIRAEWLNATPRLIDDMFTNLGRIASTYGCKIVQVPLDEISSPKRHSPFRSALKLYFALDPAEVPLAPRYQYNPLDESPLYYQKYVLRKMGFVRDLPGKDDAASSDFHIEFSWGKVDFESSQYIHTSGCVLAQVLKDGLIYLIANTIHLSRISIYNTAAANDKYEEKILEVFRTLCGNREALREIYLEAQDFYNQDIWRRRSSHNSSVSGSSATNQM